MKKKTSEAKKPLHVWEKDALLAKAQRYAEEMRAHGRDNWCFGLMSTFVLEFAARAVLANVSPALLAEQKEWDHLYFALGHHPKKAKFRPRSIDINAVFDRVQVIVPEFTEELRGFALEHINRRNEELHSGGTPFDGLQTSWQARFFEVLTVLLAAVGEDLKLLLPKDEADAAALMIASFKDESAKSVRKDVDAHKTVWAAMGGDEQKKLAKQAANWATRQAGHRVKCPACSSNALVTGEPISEPKHRLENDLIIETQDYLPSKFECVACRLKIAGLSRLAACELGAPYTKTTTYDAAEFYAPEDDFSGYEDDNNEY
ncbi:hypothetical protein N5I87_03635 [Ralstonia sp. CHL-2022]|uniref:Uncharacterized protein n=1 Tax=Ralstonia mojiangensis TaxID=2953895 RepID=A0AAE3I1R8_9RALS|nr:hypothetical protein [Ralstonia mojiangensis]MCT7315082.1 hypothetical protein [Ralstonia mojiangensis]